MTPERKWDKIVRRNWEQIRDAWLDHVPTFSSIGAIPDPGLEHLAALLTSNIPEIKDAPARFQDMEGMRRNALWEAVFLFHKCSHTHLAAQRLAGRGMHSWCMFNAYHSAYLGAKGIMALLGVASGAQEQLCPKTIFCLISPPFASKVKVTVLCTAICGQRL